MLRAQLTTANNVKSILAGLVNDKINSTLDIIHRQYQESSSIDQLAGYCHLSKNTFTRAFRQSLGHLAYQYLSLWRLEKAKQLLYQNQLTISQIAETVGYQSGIVFRKAFKNRFAFNTCKLLNIKPK